MNKVKLFKLYQNAHQLLDLSIAIQSTNTFVMDLLTDGNGVLNHREYREVITLMRLNSDAIKKLINEIKPGSLE